MSKELPENLQRALASLRDEFEKEDELVRERQIRQWKKLEFYWSGITKIWWDSGVRDWRVFEENEYEDKELNVYRAYLESIIAALSVKVPPIKCSPDDADNSSDLLTAKGGTKLAQLIYGHVDAPLLWGKALYTYCIQGMTAAYNYTVEDAKFGTVKVTQYEEMEYSVDEKNCPVCGELLETDECPVDGIVDPIVTPILKTESVPSGEIDKPKSRQAIEVLGGLYVKIPNWAKRQDDIPYLAYCYETHYSNVYKKYEHLRDKLKGDGSSTNGNELYERWGRLSPQFRGEEPTNTPTVRNWWFRPSAFEGCDEDDRKDLLKRFPKGVKCVWINELYADAVEEALDDHWTLTINPLSEYLHFVPLGQLIVSVQDINDELIALSLQTIEHGIPQVFADPSVLNFDSYRQMDTVPGSIYPAKPKSGKSLGEAFFTISTASLSPEVEPFSQKIQEMGQFVSGALPSLFGGNQANSSRTAAQYSMSKTQAMQRLGVTWKMINFWWKNTFAKVIPAYIENMLEDEREVKEEHGSFVNVLIKKSELDGKIGNVSLESSEDLPSTWGENKQTIMELMQLNNPLVMQSLGAPENMHILSKGIGLNEFNIIGQKDREKQYEEIQLLTKSEPILAPNPQTGMEEETPSVMPDYDVDSHAIEAEICKDWLVGEVGRQCKIDNEPGYKNVLLHMKSHMMMMQQQMMPPQGQPVNNGNNPTPQGNNEPQLRPLPQGKKSNAARPN